MREKPLGLGNTRGDGHRAPSCECKNEAEQQAVSNTV